MTPSKFENQGCTTNACRRHRKNTWDRIIYCFLQSIQSGSLTFPGASLSRYRGGRGGFRGKVRHHALQLVPAVLWTRQEGRDTKHPVMQRDADRIERPTDGQVTDRGFIHSLNTKHKLPKLLKDSFCESIKINKKAQSVKMTQKIYCGHGKKEGSMRDNLFDTTPDTQSTSTDRWRLHNCKDSQTDSSWNRTERQVVGKKILVLFTMRGAMTQWEVIDKKVSREEGKNTDTILAVLVLMGVTMTTAYLAPVRPPRFGLLPPPPHPPLSPGSQIHWGHLLSHLRPPHPRGPDRWSLALNPSGHENKAEKLKSHMWLIMCAV